MLRDWREAITQFGGANKELSANAFMPPYTLLTGLDFTQAAMHCDSLSAKLYTMHWSLMVKFWSDALLQSNIGLDEQLLARALVNLMDLADDATDKTLSNYGYPAPDEPHPIANEPQRRKIRQAKTATGNAADFFALVHGYGPRDDFARRLQLVEESEADGVWINRYGYLSDEKLAVIKAIWE